MRKQLARSYPQFSHFISLPFIQNEYRQELSQLQNKIIQIFQQEKLSDRLKPNNPYLFHITISMLTLNRNQTKQALNKCLKILQPSIKQAFKDVRINLCDIKYFNKWNKQKKQNEVSVIYLDVVQNEEWLKIIKVSDLVIRGLIKQNVIVQEQLKSMHIYYDHKTGYYKPQKLHITLFRINNMLQNEMFLKLYNKIKQLKINLIVNCNYFDISSRFQYDETKFYQPFFRIDLTQQ